MKRRLWTEAECQLMRELYPDLPAHQVAARLGRNVCQVHSKAKKLGLGKSDAFKTSPASGRAAPGRTIPNSMKHRFQPGLKSWNKGTRYRAGGRSVEHQFKPGQLPHNTVPVGTEVIGVDGYLKRKISDSRQSHARFNWKFVHVLVWEEHHGPVPKGHRLSFKNGDKADIRIDNLELVTHVEHMRRNSIHTVLPPELRHVVQLNGALKRKINRRVDSEKQD
jgi:hypothetical protein